MLFRKFVIGIVICVVAGLTSCRDDKDSIAYSTNSEHTLLIYMVGDETSMNSQVKQNIEKIIAGIQDCATPLNVVIYKDQQTYKQTLPVLFQLKLREDKSKVDTIYLKKWKNDLDSTDPEFMASVAKMVFSKFKSQVKGFEYWGHGYSWIPGNKFLISDSTRTRAMEYVGIDSYNNVSNMSDIWEMSDAFGNAGLHFNYMIFDACNMGSVEVAYEFKDITDYILAAPTEIQLSGFPYRQTIQDLSSISDEESVFDGLSSAYEGFKEYYDGNSYYYTGTMSLILTAGMDDLYQACRNLEAKASDVLARWEANPKEYESSVQRYGRTTSNSVGSRYYFYDVQDWADNLSYSVDGVDGSEVEEALKGVVLLHYNTTSFWGINLKRCCGLGLSIPQFWSLSGNSKLDDAYQELQWQL